MTSGASWNSFKQNKKALQRGIKAGEYIIRAEPPSIHDGYIQRSRRKAGKIIKDLNQENDAGASEPAVVHPSISVHSAAQTRQRRLHVSR